MRFIARICPRLSRKNWFKNTFELRYSRPRWATNTRSYRRGYMRPVQLPVTVLVKNQCDSPAMHALHYAALCAWLRKCWNSTLTIAHWSPSPSCVPNRVASASAPHPRSIRLLQRLSLGSGQPAVVPRRLHFAHFAALAIAGILTGV